MNRVAKAPADRLCPMPLPASRAIHPHEWPEHIYAGRRLSDGDEELPFAALWRLDR